MLYGVGCDLCQVQRMKEKLEGGHGAAFAARVFGPDEQTLLGLPVTAAGLGAHKAASAAANFAAKEAFLKAAGAGLSGFALVEIQAVRRESGAPEYRFSGDAARWMEQNSLKAHLSLSHDGGLAMACCVLETV